MHENEGRAGSALDERHVVAVDPDTRHQRFAFGGVWTRPPGRAAIGRIWHSGEELSMPASGVRRRRWRSERFFFLFFGISAILRQLSNPGCAIRGAATGFEEHERRMRRGLQAPLVLEGHRPLPSEGRKAGNNPAGESPQGFEKARSGEADPRKSKGFPWISLA